MTGRPRAASDRAIFDAISEVITESGLTGLTLASVARRVGVSAPALTQRFGTKRRMLLAYADASSRAAADLFDDARAGSSPLAALHTALSAFAGPTTTRSGMANNLAFLQLDLTDPEFAQRASRQSAEVRHQILGLVEAAVQHGELTPVVDTGVLADLVYTTYNGALITWAIDGTGPLEDWLRHRLDATLAPHRPIARRATDRR